MMGWWVVCILVALVVVTVVVKVKEISRVRIVRLRMKTFGQSKLESRIRPLRLKYPPSPGWCWPVVGHFYIMMTGRPLHRVLSELAEIHGDLYYVRLGTVHTLVVSGRQWAQRLLQHHDLRFSDRPKSEAARRLFYGSRTLVMMKYGTTWRETRRLYTLHLLTWRRISSFEGERKAEVARAVACLRCVKGVVRIRDFVFSLVGNMMTRMLFSRRAFRDYEHVASLQARGFNDMVTEIALLFGAPIIGDVVPWLGWLDNFAGFTRRMDQLAARIDSFLEDLLSDRLCENDKDKNHDDFLGLLIQAYRDDINGHITIKSILLDLLSAGTETSTTTVEWAMAELLRNPRVMQKLKEELRMATKTKVNIDDDDEFAVAGSCPSDIEIISTNDKDSYSPSAADPSELPYLQAVIKETLRLHPPLPLVIRQMHEDTEKQSNSIHSNNHTNYNNSDDRDDEANEEDCINASTLEVGDGLYRLPKGTRLVVNVWAIGRDVAVWGDNADVFWPERFIEINELSTGGAHSLARLQQQFEMLPFGYGRRGCPGANLGLATVSLVLANLVHHFDWSQLGQEANQLKELPLSHTAPMATPLLATPTPRCMDS